MPLNQNIFDDWLSDQPPESHQLLSDIRSSIIASGHNFTEGIKWGSPCYWLPEISRRTITWIQPHNDYVRLGFFNGATMPDPQNLLEGSGKKLRHIKVHNLTSPFREAKGARKRSESGGCPHQCDITPQTLTNYVQASTNLAIADPESLSG